MTRVKSHPKSFIHMFVRTCARACALHWNPPPPLLSIFLRSSFYHTSSLFIAILRIVIEPIDRTRRMIDGLSLSLSITLSIYLSFSLSRVRPSGACVNVLTPCSSLELFISLGSKRGLIITIPKNFYLNFFPQDLYILYSHNYFPIFILFNI